MTISDVILHVRYTARQGGTELGGKAIEEMRGILSDAKNSGIALFFSLQHDFPTEWASFVKGTADSVFSAPLRKDHFPYLVQGQTLNIEGGGEIALGERDGRRVSWGGAGLGGAGGWVGRGGEVRGGGPWSSLFPFVLCAGCVGRGGEGRSRARAPPPLFFS